MTPQGRLHPEKDRRDVLMLLGNGFAPDPRVYSEARAMTRSNYRIGIVGWDREGGLPREEHQDGILVRRIHVASAHGRGWTQIFYLGLFWLKASWYVLRAPCVAVHCHDFDTLPVGFLCARMKRVPVVYDSHESYADLMSGSLPRSLVKFIRKSESWLLKRVDLTITVGGKLARRLAKDGARDVVVVGNWKDPEQFRFSEEDLNSLRQELEIPSGSLVISFIANLDNGRKIEELLKAVAGLPGVYLVVGGVGPSSGRVIEYDEANSNIRYLGWVDPEAIPKYAKVSDVIYYGFDSSNRNADFSAPNKLFEALAAGAAVLTGSFGEIGEIVGNHSTGIVLPDFDPATIRSAVIRLRDNRDVLERMKQRSRELGKSTYNLARAEEQLLAAYDRLLSDHGTRSRSNGVSEAADPRRMHISGSSDE